MCYGREATVVRTRRPRTLAAPRRGTRRQADPQKARMPRGNPNDTIQNTTSATCQSINTCNTHVLRQLRLRAVRHSVPDGRVKHNDGARLADHRKGAVGAVSAPVKPARVAKHDPGGPRRRRARADTLDDAAVLGHRREAAAVRRPGDIVELGTIYQSGVESGGLERAPARDGA